MITSMMRKGIEYHVVELSFGLIGHAVPVDHGYAFYAGLTQIVSELHSAKGISIQPIRGTYYGNGKLHLRSCCKTPHTHRFNNNRIMLI